MKTKLTHLCSNCTKEFPTCDAKRITWGIDGNPGACGAAADKVLTCDGYHPNNAASLPEPMFTPGPWRVAGLDQPHDGDRTIYARTPIHGNPRYIASVYGEGVTVMPSRERMANAVLVVAAPTMFETLFGILSSFDAGEDIKTKWEQVVREMVDLVLTDFTEPIEITDGIIGMVRQACGETGITPEQRFPIEDWKYEVANGDTTMGYAEWLAHSMEAYEHDLEMEDLQ